MLKIKDLNKDLFPHKFLSFLPETCDSCGSDIEIIESLSYIQCSNPFCISKISYRLYLLLKDLGITMLSIEDCKKFLLYFETYNPYAILLYNPLSDGELFVNFGLEKSEQLFKELNKKRGMLLWEFVKIGNFIGLNDSVEKLLKDYTDLTLFYKDLSEGGIGFIQSLLLKNTEYENSDSICIDAVIIYDILITNQKDLIEGLNGIVIINPEHKLGILFANDVENYFSNKDFLTEINKKLKNRIYLYPLYILNDSVSLVYWDNAGLNVENSIIKNLNENYSNIPIINTENIFDKILEVLTQNG